MNVLLVGAGGVGEAIAIASQNRPWLQKMVLADYSLGRAEEVQRKLGQAERFPVETLDARDRKQVAEIARRHGAGIVMNAVSNIYNDPVFDAAGEAGCHYLDMAMSGNGAAMGGYQFGQAQAWAEKGILALLGVGADPGMSDVFAKYAAKHLFDTIDEIGIRDGAALEVEGTDFAPAFSLIDTIEECTDPPLIWEKDRGWYETELFSEPEIFDFPEGIGPLECVNVEHEEVVLIPRVIDCRRVTFKYALGDKFIEAIKVIKLLGMESPEPVQVGQGEGGAARRGGGVPARSGAFGRAHAWQDVCRDLGERHEGWQAAPGVSVSGHRQRSEHGQVRLSGGLVADGRGGGDRAGAGGHRGVEGRWRARPRGL